MGNPKYILVMEPMDSYGAFKIYQNEPDGISQLLVGQYNSLETALYNMGTIYDVGQVLLAYSTQQTDGSILV